MSLDLSPEIEKMIRERAAAEGVSVNDLLARAFAPDKIQTPPTDPTEQVLAMLAQWQAQDHTPLRTPIPTRPGETPTQALFRKWAEEDAHMTDDDREAEDRLWEDLEQSLKENGRAIRLRRLG